LVVERLVAVAALAALLSSGTPPRPHILGISHVGLRVSSVAAARSFYEDFLGLRGLRVNGRQYVELIPRLAPGQDRLDHIALETDDAEGLRRYLASRAVDVPDRVSRDEAGRRFTVHDPDGHAVEFVQPSPTGRRALARTEPASGARISDHILHLGIIVGDVAASMKFYGDVLGFSETWRGSRSGTELSWINMKVPDGGDYVEFMLYGARPAPDARGTQHHICLEVPDLAKAQTLLEARPYRASYARPLEPRVGTNRKRQLNLYDPDGTRVELMEPGTVDGQPTPSSTAPPPRHP
jgi:catechol 2,3-dioxygenase-like lactoylglutathione lyase family enzyme